MIKWIIFDLGGVYFTRGSRIAIGQLIKEFPEMLPETINYIVYGRIGRDYRKGLHTKKEFWKKAQETTSIKFNTQKFASIWHDSYKVKKGVERIVKKLSKKYDLAIISGTTRERVKFLDEKYDFKKYFKERIFTYNVNANKKSRKIYRVALKRLKAKPSECLFIDDYPWHAKYAQSLGIKTILFKNAEQLKKDLKKHGVKI
ncbi:HAD-IA family hydrolase [archaeon]|nr:HAD-IA family hydrolase [archaeon]